MNEEVVRHGGVSDYIKLEEDGSLDFRPYGAVSFYIHWPDGEEIENGLRMHFFQLLNVVQWACDIEFCFDENGCHIERMEMTFY